MHLLELRIHHAKMTVKTKQVQGHHPQEGSQNPPELYIIRRMASSHLSFDKRKYSSRDSRVFSSSSLKHKPVPFRLGGRLLSWLSFTLRGPRPSQWHFQSGALWHRILIARSSMLYVLPICCSAREGTAFEAAEKQGCIIIMCKSGVINQ